jgi:hypothetical protein
MPAVFLFLEVPRTLGPVDFVGLNARVKPTEAWHRIDSKNASSHARKSLSAI